jgi:hypothetical protein
LIEKYLLEKSEQMGHEKNLPACPHAHRKLFHWRAHALAAYRIG